MLVAVQLLVPGLYLPPVLKLIELAASIRPRRSFHCRSTLPCDRSGQWARWSCWWPSNYPCWDCISRQCSKLARLDHIRPRRSFHCRSTLPCEASARGRVGGAGGCPTIRAGIVSPASVQIGWYHRIRPRRSFHCRSRLPCDRIGQRARWWCWWLSNCPCRDCISRQCPQWL